MQPEHEAYWEALRAADRPAALAAVVAARERGAGPLEIIEDLIVPAQVRIGELWLDGEWSVEDEHAATAINEGLVHWVCSFAAPPAPDAPLVLVSCVEHERHTLPALVVAEELGLAGYRVHLMPEDQQPGDLLREVLVTKPRAVLFSASLTSSLATQKSLFGNLRSVGIPVIVGGQAFGNDERRALALGATAYAATSADALRLIEELPVRTPRHEPDPSTPADAEAGWIHEFRSEITPYVIRAVARSHRAEGTPSWWLELEGHVDHLLGCVAASLVTGDETIVVEMRDWFEHLLQRRGAPQSLVQEVWGLLADALRGHPLARLHLAGGAPVTATARGAAAQGNEEAVA
ncbi:cobalamin B12-binding domain-containing protein [Nocardioides sp. KIGAM211]|uniref:Cobalamin B12-binding domain-containing protein n=1 Tax=Nocardioides luti TaxID=2761101 RepID=A0A7X0RIA4_9ACTN|nr:B12-binding domain-containing protein [Nocardioides luti]MBB6628806.1 cobalamin B12-binding domain-containing protein [Nocardioides luti]